MASSGCDMSSSAVRRRRRRQVDNGRRMQRPRFADDGPRPAQPLHAQVVGEEAAVQVRQAERDRGEGGVAGRTVHLEVDMYAR